MRTIQSCEQHGNNALECASQSPYSNIGKLEQFYCGGPTCESTTMVFQGPQKYHAARRCQVKRGLENYRALEKRPLGARQHGHFMPTTTGLHSQEAWRGNFECLNSGNPEAIELVVRYPEANPWYFRSGYHKAEILKFLKRHPLTEDQCARLRKVILDRVRGTPVREMRAYGRVTPRVTDEQFEAELFAINENSNRQSVP